MVLKPMKLTIVLARYDFLKPSLYSKINLNYVCSAICINAVIIAWSRKKGKKAESSTVAQEVEIPK